MPDLHSIGNVVFEEAFNTHGTVVRVEMQYLPPAGVIGPPIAALFDREPSQQLYDDLRRLKQLLETGEIITTEGQPAGRCHSLSWRYDSTAVGERKS